MLYTIIGEDIPGTLKLRLETRPAHIDRLNALKNAGSLILAGPFPAIDSEDPGDAGFTGSLIIAEFNSLTDAQQWADQDPYISAGVYNKVTVKPYIKVLP